MAATDEPGFEIAPTRIGRPGGDGGGGPPRRGRATFVLVVLAVLAIPAIAFLGPRIEWRPAIDLTVLRPTATPSSVPSSAPTAAPIPTATPLPSITIAAGPLPDEPLPIDASGFRLIDPASGALGPGVGVRLDNDAVFRAAGGDGWWCVCFRHEPAEGSETVEVTVRHFDRNLGDGTSIPIATYKSQTPPPSQDFGVRLDLDRSLDGRIGYLAVGQRSLIGWTVHVDVIDLEHGRLIGSSALATIEVPPAEETPSSSADAATESYLGGPTIRLSPDGRRLLVTASVDTFEPTAGTSESASYGWLADVAPDGSADPIAATRAVEPSVLDQIANCGWLAWIGPDELVMTCGPINSSTTISVRAIDLTGRQTGAASFDAGDQVRVAEPLIDAANRVVYFWETDTHILHRLDLRSVTSAEIDVNPSRGATTAIATPIPGVAPLANLPPSWAAVTGDFGYTTPQLVAGPGGTRLYAIGTVDGRAGGDGGQGSGSTGIWVFDARTFANVDHWPAAAAYTSMSLTPDGRWLMATGQAGMDAAGNPAGWDSSVSVHDTVDGRLVLQLGDLGEWQVLTLR